ncbi:YciI family protein [Phenylobacterium sp.]|uniref:YciI family protein n=1 Tax=Phenylobacterium sp. TaxID=1871053 RepID=UPI00356944D3
MQFVCLIYFEPEIVFGGGEEAKAVLAEVGPHGDRHKAAGHVLMSQALTLPNEAVTVRVRGGRISQTDGPFAETKEVLGGFVLIEAADRDEAAAIAATNPFARLGSIEVRPVVDFSKPRPQL